MAVFLLNSRLDLLCDTTFHYFHNKVVTLLPKLRVHFAEFLNASSHERLRFLIPSTCVGLRYGLLQHIFRQYFLMP